MTVIAYRDGVMAADSRMTVETEAGGIRMARCEKMYCYLDGLDRYVVIGVAGEGFPALRFVEWYKNGPLDEPPVELFTNGDANFSAIVLTHEGLFEYDKWCIGEKILDDYYAIGCGAKAALGAMHRGATAEEAVVAACAHDPLCGLPGLAIEPGTKTVRQFDGVATPPKPAR
jgi:hypothetical protein